MFLKNLSRWASVELIPTNSISGCVQREILYIYMFLSQRKGNLICSFILEISRSHFPVPRPTRAAMDRSTTMSAGTWEMWTPWSLWIIWRIVTWVNPPFRKSTGIVIFYFLACPFKANPGRTNTQLKKQHWLQGSTQRPSIPDGPQKCCNSISDFFCRIILVCQIVGSSSQGSFCSQLYFCALCCCILKSTGGGNSSLEPTKRNKVEPHIESE